MLNCKGCSYKHVGAAGIQGHLCHIDTHQWPRKHSQRPKVFDCSERAENQRARRENHRCTGLNCTRNKYEKTPLAASHIHPYMYMTMNDSQRPKVFDFFQTLPEGLSRESNQGHNGERWALYIPATIAIDCSSFFIFNPPTVWPFNITNCGFEWQTRYASLK